ncbi:MAG: hypothetical protein CVU98_01105 [Firmicutes bacterium HGW-Firmicutes-3]|nr:MAG: hypothetical protein CVU98_01105 [Firmicutes bacterium HGW-Firmicutes-3]
MNLLIIGAGEHGCVVKETAEAMNKFIKINYLDDKSDLAIGKCSEYEDFIHEYTHAFVAIGNNEIRSHWYKKLEQAGYLFPVLIHPSAYVSPSAVIELGVVVLPSAVIHTNAVIKQGSIIGMGSLIDHDATIDVFCHINTGAIVKARSTLTNYSKIDSAEICPKKQFNQEYTCELGV